MSRVTSLAWGVLFHFESGYQSKMGYFAQRSSGSVGVNDQGKFIGTAFILIKKPVTSFCCVNAIGWPRLVALRLRRLQCEF